MKKVSMYSLLIVFLLAMSPLPMKAEDNSNHLMSLLTVGLGMVSYGSFIGLFMNLMPCWVIYDSIADDLSKNSFSNPEEAAKLEFQKQENMTNRNKAINNAKFYGILCGASLLGAYFAHKTIQ
jgi:hypothetical protein